MSEKTEVITEVASDSVSNLEQIGTEALAKLMDWINSAEGFISEQAPELAKEIVTFGRAYHLIPFVCFFIFITMFFVFAKKANKDGWETPQFFTPNAIIAFVSGMLTFFTAVIALHNTKQLFMAWFAPRLYIIDYASNILDSL